VKYPDSKISHTILEFGKGLINELPEPHSRQDLENAMKLIVTVWNACVMDQINGNSNYVTTVEDLLKEMPPEAKLHIKRLVKRKYKRFADDLRGVGHHAIVERKGEFSFRCHARAVAGPETLH